MQDDGHVLVIGAAGSDLKGHPDSALQLHTSNPGHIRDSYGGVARNIAENLARLDIETVLLTAVGEDTYGDLIMAHAAVAGVDVSHVLQIAEARTGSYVAIMDEKGDLNVAVSDYASITAYLTPAYIHSKVEAFAEARMAVIDLNLLPETIDTIINLCHEHSIPLGVDPTSAAHASKIGERLRGFHLITPNAAELRVLCGLSIEAGDTEKAVSAARQLVTMGINIGIITLGDHGVAYADSSSSGYIPARKTSVVDSTGAGDALTAGVVFGLLNELSLEEAMRLGITAASLTLNHRESVIPDLSPDLLFEHLH
jgi:pseudouridine kinase